MVMDTRTTDRMSRPFYYAEEQSYQPGGPFSPYTSEAGHMPDGVNGSFKQVVSERDGSFTPGTYRANPCLLREASVGSLDGLAYGNKPSWGNWSRLVGGFWRKIYWTNKTRFSFETYGNWNQNSADFAQVKAEAKLGEAEWNATCSLGEIAETIAMLKNPLQNITKLFSVLNSPRKLAKQLNLHGYKTNKTMAVTDAATGSWLLYRYGISPLIADIAAGIKYVEDTIQKKVEGLQRCGGGQEVVEKWTEKVSTTLIWYTWDTLYSFERRTRTHATVYYEQELISQLFWTLKSLGAHPSQIPSNIWEWTWLSFVVDWWFKVGDWLQAIMPAPGISIKGRSISQKTTTSVDCDVVSIRCAFGLRPDSPVVLPYYRWRSQQLERRIPTTAVALPPFDPNFLKLKRVLDALSLTWTLGTGNLKRVKHASQRLSS